MQPSSPITGSFPPVPDPGSLATTPAREDVERSLAKENQLLAFLLRLTRLGQTEPPAPEKHQD